MQGVTHVFNNANANNQLIEGVGFCQITVCAKNDYSG